LDEGGNEEGWVDLRDCNIFGFCEQTFGTTFVSQYLNDLELINEFPEKNGLAGQR
jgi:hypothetical protein